MGAFVVTKVNPSTFFLILTSICLVSVFVNIPLKKPVQSEFQRVETVEDNKVSETWKLAKSNRMLVFIPILAQSGQIVAFRAACMVQMFVMTMEKSDT